MNWPMRPGRILLSCGANSFTKDDDPEVSKHMRQAMYCCIHSREQWEYEVLTPI